jgi:hypothetical protein
MTTKQLTVKEALEQGYQHYFYNSDGWQAMKHISDIEKEPESIDWSREDIYIVEKEPSQAVSLSEGELKELIIDHFDGQYYDITGSDDSNTVSDAFSDVDFSPFEKVIESVLEGLTTYRPTEIKLVP